MEEVVLLRLPGRVATIQEAAHAFHAQFGDVVMYVLGHITLDQGALQPACLLAKSTTTGCRVRVGGTR